MNGKTVAGVAVMAAVVLVGIGMAALYAGGPPPTPERPKAAPPIETVMNGELRFSPVVYRGQLEQDARTFGVPPPTLEEFQAPFLYVDELREPVKLDDKKPVETPHLRLSLDVEKNRASLDGQSFHFDHLVLRIENKTSHYLAYRILTDVPNRKKCGAKGDIPHNAIVIEPKQTLRRTECLYRHNAAIEVTRVEIIELPALAAVYASRLPASAVLYDARTAAGHVPLRGALCPQTFSWREVRDGIDRKKIGWRDVIDYYARHSCEEYAFFESYRFRTDPASLLPARPME
jgi:hypothetical protein